MNHHDLLPLLEDLLMRGMLLLPVCVLVSLLLRRGSASLLRRFWRCALVALLAATVLSLAPPLVKFEPLTLIPPMAEPDPGAPPEGPFSATVPGSPLTPLEEVMGLPKDPVPGPRPGPSPLTTPGPDGNPTPGSPLGLPALLGLAWLAGVAILLLRKVLGLIGIIRLRRAAQPVADPDWHHDLMVLRESCGVTQEVALRHHLALRSPIVTGLRKPVIILPSDFAAYSPDDRRAVLLHELAHVRHRDAHFRGIAGLAKILHWPNPLVWFAERSLRLAEERASDDAVLRGGIAAPNYAQLLARLAKGGNPLIGNPSTNGQSAMAQPKTLLPRVHAILRPRQARHQPGRAVSLTLATSAVVLGVLAGGSTFVEAEAAKKAPPQENTAAENPSPAPSSVIDQKLDSIVIPEVNFADVTLDGALDYLRTVSQELDQGPGTRGLNIISKIPPLPDHLEAGGVKESAWYRALTTEFSLHLEQVTLRALLRYICEVTGTAFRSSEYAVMISLFADEGSDLLSKNFRLPPEVYEAELAKAAQSRHAGSADEGPFSEGDPDPFADDGTGNAVPLSATDWLKTIGLDFPPGSRAFYIKATGVLNVQNTPVQLDFIGHIIDSLNQRPSRVGLLPAEAARLAAVKKALQEIILPDLNFERATLAEVLDFLKTRARELSGDDSHLNPVQFVVLGDSTAPSRKLNLKLRQVPLGVAIKHVVDLAAMQSTVGAYAIELRPRYIHGGGIHLAPFLLTPEQMQQIVNSLGTKPEHLNATEILREVGIDFPPGACTFWNSKTGELIVRNTIQNLSEIEVFLQGLQPSENN